MELDIHEPALPDAADQKEFSAEADAPKKRKSKGMTKSADTAFTRQDVLQFHNSGKPGKLEIVPTKPLATARDLSLAYSPGVAVPVEEIARDPSLSYDYTARGNLVAVISNGTAILRQHTRLGVPLHWPPPLSNADAKATQMT